MLKVKSLLDYTNLFSPNKNQKNGKNNTKLFSITNKVKMNKIYFIICGKYKKFKNPKLSYIFEKTILLSIIRSKWDNEDEKIFR